MIQQKFAEHEYIFPPLSATARSRASSSPVDDSRSVAGSVASGLSLSFLTGSKLKDGIETRIDDVYETAKAWLNPDDVHEAVSVERQNLAYRNFGPFYLVMLHAFHSSAKNPAESKILRTEIDAQRKGLTKVASFPAHIGHTDTHEHLTAQEYGKGNERDQFITRLTKAFDRGWDELNDAFTARGLDPLGTSSEEEKELRAILINLCATYSEGHQTLVPGHSKGTHPTIKCPFVLPVPRQITHPGRPLTTLYVGMRVAMEIIKANPERFSPRANMK